MTDAVYWNGSLEGEPSMSCVSIVAEAVNTIFHGHNMEYSNTEYLKQITITVDFKQGGITKCSGTTFVGFIGLYSSIMLMWHSDLYSMDASPVF